MAKTSIEWTDTTWNPVRGCTKISPGCKHCYAETFAERWRGIPGHPYEQGFDLRLVPEKLGEPLKWRKPLRVFVNSMSDLFHDDVPFEYVAAVFGVMAACPQHAFQVLTKRPGRMREFFVWIEQQLPSRHTRGAARGVCWYAWERGIEAASPSRNDGTVWPLPNVWLGVSVEDRKYGLPRIDELRATPAAVRFLSVEPLLEDLGHLDLAGIDWVIVGGESGHGARPMHADWVRAIRDQVLALRQLCEVCDYGPPPCNICHGRGYHGPSFFFKQWGEWGPAPWKLERMALESDDMYKMRSEAECATHSYAVWASRYGWQPHEAAHHPWSLERCADLGGTEQAPIRKWGKKAAGRELDGVLWSEFPRMGV
jgi:protein gp37